MTKEIHPPKAKKIPKELEIHGDKRTDDYFWMNERDNPEVLDYLHAENAYYEKMTAHTKSFREDLFREMKSRIKLDDESVPFKQNGYWYYVRYEENGDYPIYCRKKDHLQNKEEIMFNVNEMAKPHDFFKLGGLSISPDNKRAVFAVDTLGRRQYALQVKNLSTGEIYADKIENTVGGAAWANDSRTFFYARKDEKTLRSDKIYRHSLGQKDEDQLIYHEKDETFSVGVARSKSRQFI